MLARFLRKAEPAVMKGPEGNVTPPPSSISEVDSTRSCTSRVHSDTSTRKTEVTVSYKSITYSAGQLNDEANDAITTEDTSTPSPPSPVPSIKLHITCGVATHRGRRCTQEDMYFIGQKCPQRVSLNGVFKPGYTGCFGIFDGHGGVSASQYCAHAAFRKVREKLNENKSNLQDTLYETIYALDTEFTTIASRHCATRQAGRKPPLYEEGTTCLLAVLRNDKVHVANVGDSRAIISTHKGKPIVLTTDHKPNSPEERKRILSRGGFITGHHACFYAIWPLRLFLDVPRVNGILSLSRSIGDIQLKRYLSCEPDIITHSVDLKSQKYLIMATDGLWDVLSNSRVAHIASCYDDPQDAADALVLEALRKKTHDNVTVLVIDLTFYVQ